MTQERWEALIDREVVGEALTAEEQAFVADYERDHPECAEERALWGETLEAVRRQPMPSEGQLEALAARALAAHHGEPEPAMTTAGSGGHRDQGRSSRRVLAVATLAAAAAVALWWQLDRPEPIAHESTTSTPTSTPSPTVHPPQPVDPTPAVDMIDAVDPQARVALLAGVAEEAVESAGMDPLPALGAALSPGAGLQLDGRGCLFWQGPTAVVCVDDPRLQLVEGAVGERRLRLEQGLLVAALDPLGPGQRFVVETMVGTVSAVGTVFAVEVRDGKVRALVLEGEVEVADLQPRRLTVGHATSLQAEILEQGVEIDALTNLRERARTLADVAERWREADTLGDADLRIAAAGRSGRPIAGEDLRLDGRSLGSTPVALRLPSGPHLLEYGDQARRLELASADALAITLEAAKTSKPEPIPSAASLAEQAQRARMARDYDETARLYRLLLEHHGDSPEASNIPVRLGDLLMSTGDHQGALDAYERYLQHPGWSGPLAPEAALGRIKALEALGRHEAALRAAEDFAARYPEDHRADPLRAPPP